MRSKLMGVAFGTLLGLGVAPASAASPTDRVVAQSLFDEARALMDQGEYDRACPKFAESQQLDPAGGTLLNLGICYEKQGRTASAWAALEEARVVARKEGRQDRLGIADKHLQAIKPRLSTLRVDVSSEARVQGLSITLDGTELPASAWGSPVPADPGKRVLRAVAPGKEAWSKTVSVGEKDAVVLAVPPLASSASSGVQREAHQDVPDSGSRSTFGYVVGGAGVVALGVGTYFGLAAFSSWDKRNDACTDVGCTNEAVGHADDTRRNADISTVAFGLGIVGVGAGAYLLLTDSSSEEPEVGVTLSPVVGRDGGGMHVGGTF